MEDLCWQDVPLTADPKIPDGGRANGFGSLQKYVAHCEESKHKQARNARLVKQVGGGLWWTVHTSIANSRAYQYHQPTSLSRG